MLRAPSKGNFALYYAGRRLPNLSQEQFQKYWRNTHGQLAKRHAKALGVRRYMQVHTIDNILNELMQAQRGTMNPYDGMAILEVEPEKMFEALSTPEGQRAAVELFEDEKNFTDFSRSALRFGKEIVIFESE